MLKVLQPHGSGSRLGLEISDGPKRRKGSRTLLALAAALLLAAPLRAQERPACGGRTALVLSGGGAKGIAHTGVIRALDSMGIRPDLVVGTSMGAIIGALYASGYSGSQIDSIDVLP